MALVNDEVFLAAYNKLNATQKKAVDTIDGPVMVVAGPGTGKTQILTLRIANILRLTDTAPESVLALTFTKSGAKAMRERLSSFMGVTAYRIPIFTFHGLAERLIRDYPESYANIIGSLPATDIEKISFIEQILEDSDLSILRPHGDPSFYVKPLLSVISTMKQENVRPENLAAIIAGLESDLLDIPQWHEKGAHKGKERGEYTKAVARLHKLQALLRVYQTYVATMQSHKRYDFDDMILETVAVLRGNEMIRLDLQERYQYVLADEHQDVNGAQNEILNHLTSYHDRPNIFVVGDEKQAIYRFQGASLENFLYFVEHYHDTQLITLTDNYRSTQEILNIGHDLVAVDEEHVLAPYRVALKSFMGSGIAPVVSVYPHEGFEDQAVVDCVAQKIASGVALSEIAVIVRSNREVENLTTLLRLRGIAVKPSADSDILGHPLFLALLDLAEMIVYPHDEALLSRVVLAPYWGTTLADLSELMAKVTYDRPLSKLLFDEEAWQAADLQPWHNLKQVIVDIRNAMLTESPHRLLARLLTESHFLEYAATADPMSSTYIIRRVYDEVEALVSNKTVLTLREVVNNLRQRIQYGVALNAPLLADSVEAVAVMTAHKSKGLEFAVVIIPHVTDARWGVNKRPDYFKVPLFKTVTDEYEALEDERRLLYVAMTRAKSTLLLSYSDTNAEGKELLPSPLLDSLPAPVVANDIVKPSLLTQARVSTDLARIFCPYIEKSLRERGLSATALNNAIKNPWNFLYRNVIRLPEVQASSLQFGTAMHSVLEYATRYYSSNKSLPSFNSLNQRLESALGSLPMSVVEFTNLLARGQSVLAVYLEHLPKTLLVSTKEELSLRVMLETSCRSMPQILLTGKLDRLDLDDGGYAQKVVDYKTGKAKSRNEIEGKTAKNDASYRRQLAFYSLLLHLHGDEKYMTESGVLSFIEPDNKGQIHDEQYESDATQRQLLADEVQSTLDGLLSGAFLQDEALLADSDYAVFGRALRDRL